MKLSSDKRLCLLYNFAPHYREAIFRMIDSEYDCDWYFGKNDSDIKGMNLSVLKRTVSIDSIRIPHTPVYWQKGVQKLLSQDRYRTYFILGDIHCMSTWMLLIRAKLFYSDKRIYLWSHGWYGKENLIKRVVKKLFFKLSDGIFLYGHYARNLMIAQGFSPEKLFVIHNSLSYESQLKLRNIQVSAPIYRNHFGNKAPILLFIGRLTAVKRLDMLIRAVGILKRQGQVFNIVFVGDGAEREHLQHIVEEEKLTDNVWFYGPCYDECENAVLLFNADLCVAPGNVGLTAIHSMVYGTPVVTHDNFAYQMPEFEAIHDDETGAFFHYGEVKSLAETISLWFARHEADRESVRQKCYDEIDRFWTPDYQLDIIKKHLVI